MAAREVSTACVLQVALCWRVAVVEEGQEWMWFAGMTSHSLAPWEVA